MSFGKPKGKFLKTRPSYVVETEEEDTGFGGFKAEWTRKAKAERREFMTSFVARRAAGNAEPEVRVCWTTAPRECFNLISASFR
tara:strand:+ start:389 stop:640 length:252 start_codon:yes stop_codon:yes gene_type:complete